MKPRFTIGKRDKTPVITFPGPNGLGSTFTILVQSDEHHDNPKSRIDMAALHMQQAVDEGAPIIKLGDQLCMMQGRYDPRKSRGGIKPEHDKPDYIGAVTSSYADYLKPYAKNIVFMGQGNHELSIIKNNETDPTARVCERLRQYGSNVVEGGIGGWIIVRVYLTKTNVISTAIHWHHGAAGGGIVTKGIINSNRKSASVGSEASVFLGGHIHESWCVEICRDRLNVKTGRTFIDSALHVTSATYKQEFDPAGSSWHSLQARPPKPLGGTWLDFHLEASHEDGSERPDATGKRPLYKLRPDVRRAR